MSLQLRSRQADEYRNLEEDYRQRHQKLREDHEQEIQNCIRQYFAKNNQDQPEDLSLHRQHEYSSVANSSAANIYLLYVYLQFIICAIIIRSYQHLVNL